MRVYKSFAQLREQWITILVYILYLILLSYTLLHHEPWGDELHSWNIAKASQSFPDLIHNIRYEGHPPLWFALLWILSSIGHDPAYMQAMQYFIAGLAVFLVMFRSPFPLAARLLMPFGYYFLYEYGVFSRSYGLALLLSCGILTALQLKPSRYKHIFYYTLLFLLANTLLVSAVLAAAIHFYVLLRMRNQRVRTPAWATHGIFGLLALLPALYVIFPPADSELNMAFWLNRWDLQQLKSAFAIPVRAFMPVSAWWEHHFWNTHCLLQIQDPLRLLRGAGYLLSVLFPVLAMYILKDERKSRLLFLANLLVTLAMGILIPLTNARYVGFVFIGFIAAAWLHQGQKELRGRRLAAFYALLIIQIAGSLVAIPKDIKHVFSNAFRAGQMLKAVPAEEMVATDFFGLTAAAAYAAQPFYCIEKNKPAYFLQWNQEMTNLDARKNRYVKGATYLFNTTGRGHFYLLTTNSIKGLKQTDTGLFNTLNVTLLDGREGAIEKYSNIYLYRIER